MERRLETAARAEGEAVSEFMRRAASERADATSGGDVAAALEGVLGVVRSEGGVARQTGNAFTDVLATRRR